ncbi:MAG TPA: glycosyl hydrolase [Candidatus Acidoferrales bacterium]
MKALQNLSVIALSLFLFFGTGKLRSVPAETAADALSALQRAFENPPDDSKIMVRWWWFGPSATKPELEREMLAMKEGGIGGFEVQPVYPLALDDPAHGFKNYPYLSDDFLEALKFTGEKAHELGLRMDLTIGSGWPFGGPHVPITQAAGKLRIDIVPADKVSGRVPMPNIPAGEKLLAAFVAPGDVKNFDAAKATALPSLPNDVVDDVYVHSQQDGPHVVLFFIASRTGMTVKRPAIGAEGFVLDHYDRVAIENHLKVVGDTMLNKLDANIPYAVFCDSLEVYGSDWTGDFLEEFQKRRGYDLKRYLPALVGNIGEKTGAIRNDWGKTLSELFEERFLMPTESWAKAHHTLFRAQLYGIPPATLSSYRLIDLGEGEGAHWKQFSPTRWASSANHLYGRAVTSTETWTWLHSPAFRATPLDMKAEADVQFLQGSNQFVGHGWPYSPPEAGSPGWAFYAASVLNQHNPWWPAMPDITKYFQRVSFLLRQGRPVNDVAIYVPTSDAYAQFTPGKVSIHQSMNNLLGPNLIPQILESGYNFDFIDDTAIQNLGKVAYHALAVNSNRYSIIILPGVERIPLATLQKLKEFAAKGGVVIATRKMPSMAPGLADAEKQTAEIRAITKELFDGPCARVCVLTDEKKQLGAMLNRLERPDVSFYPPAPDIGFVHRNVAGWEVYFIVNTSNRPIKTLAKFRRDFALEPAQVEEWDPYTGAVRTSRDDAGLVEESSQSTAIELEPYESRVLVFTAREQSARAQATRTLPEPMDWSNGWNVSFGDSGKPVHMDHLRSWTDDETTKYFSGRATYVKTVSIPDRMLNPALEYKLDFGEGTAVAQTSGGGNGMRAWMESPVREAAVVYVNGKRAGSVWHPPYSVDVTKYLRSGQNEIRVVVGNSAINELAGRPLPDYKLLNSRYGERATPQDMKDLQPLPSGILGRVRLIAEQAQRMIPAN